MRVICKKNPIGDSSFKPEQSGRAECQMLQSDGQNLGLLRQQTGLVIWAWHCTSYMAI